MKTWKLPIPIETSGGLIKCLALFVLGFLRGTPSCGTRKERKPARSMWTPIYGGSIEGDFTSCEHCAQRSNQPSNMKWKKRRSAKAFQWHHPSEVKETTSCLWKNFSLRHHFRIPMFPVLLFLFQVN